MKLMKRQCQSATRDEFLSHHQVQCKLVVGAVGSSPAAHFQGKAAKHPTASMERRKETRGRGEHIFRKW